VRSLQSEALILTVTDLAEADRVVEFLTREHGKRRGAARGAKRRFSRFAGELQPLARARIGWFEKEGRDLVRISSVELLRAPRGLDDLEGLLVGAYLAETAATFAPEGEPAERPFRLLDAAIEALAEAIDRRLVVRYFESWILRLAGVFPNPEVCPLCGGPLAGGAALAGGGDALVCRGCAADEPGSRPVSAAAIDFWIRAGRENLRSMSGRPPSAATLEEVGDVVGRVRRHFLGHELKSLGVLRRTLGDTAPI